MQAVPVVPPQHQQQSLDRHHSIAAGANGAVAGGAAGAAGVPGQVPIAVGVVDEEAAKLSKLEAKRIKNRLSAARSNHKRRLQLEAQKKELALLRKRVEELKSKKQLVTAENESLKKKVAQEDISLEG